MRMRGWRTQMALILLVLEALALAWTFALTGCAGGPEVQIADITLYGDLGVDGAAVVHTLTTQQSQMSDSDWRGLWYNPGMAPGPMVCMSYKDFAQIKKEQETLCSYYGGCSDQIVQSANALMGRVQRALRIP